MKTKIKPIIRKEFEEDRLVDVVDVEAVEAIEASDQQEAVEAVPAHQLAVVVRAFPDLKTAKENDGKVLDEEFDEVIVQAFLQSRIDAEAQAVVQAEKDASQDQVDRELAKAVFGITTLLKKYIPNLTAGEATAIEVFRTKYQNWLAKQ